MPKSVNKVRKVVIPAAGSRTVLVVLKAYSLALRCRMYGTIPALIFECRGGQNRD